MRRLANTATLFAALLILAACARPPAAQPGPAAPEGTRPPAAAGRPLTVAAAANLQPAMAEIGRLFTERTGQQVTFSFGSTGNLVKQIENGAPVDLLAAADVASVDGLRARGLILPDTRQIYAAGRIVLAGSKAAGVRVQELRDLLNPQIKYVAIANPQLAPYGLAARQALMRAGIWDQIQPKLVLGENIRHTLQLVQTGNAEAGVVALSLAAEAPEITYTLIDESLHEPLHQALGVVKGSANEQAARAFARFLLGPEGRQILQKYGYQAPGRPGP